MAKGSRLGMERIDFTDPATGVPVVQITSNPTMSTHAGYETMAFTPDSSRFIFFSHRSTERGAPRDLFMANSDGSDLTQVTDCDGLGDTAMSLDGKTAFISVRNEIRAVDLETFEEKTLAAFEENLSVGAITAGGDYVFAKVNERSDKGFLFRCNTDGSDHLVLREETVFNHIMASRTGNYLGWIKNDEINEYDTQTFYVMKSDGTENHPWAIGNWSHSGWVGMTDRMQGCLLKPERAIAWVSPEETEPQIIASGVYFLHSSGSVDGEWLAADTNWPNIGIQLVHIASGRYQTLCLDQSSIGHPQYTHPHPVISPDGSKVLFNSDRTGITQVYVATVPDYLKEELRTGELTNRGRRRAGQWL